MENWRPLSLKGIDDEDAEGNSETGTNQDSLLHEVISDLGAFGSSKIEEQVRQSSRRHPDSSAEGEKSETSVTTDDGYLSCFSIESFRNEVRLNEGKASETKMLASKHYNHYSRPYDRIPPIIRGESTLKSKRMEEGMECELECIVGDTVEGFMTEVVALSIRELAAAAGIDSQKNKSTPTEDVELKEKPYMDTPTQADGPNEGVVIDGEQTITDQEIDTEEKFAVVTADFPEEKQEPQSTLKDAQEIQPNREESKIITEDSQQQEKKTPATNDTLKTESLPGQTEDIDLLVVNVKKRIARPTARSIRTKNIAKPYDDSSTLSSIPEELPTTCDREESARGETVTRGSSGKGGGGEFLKKDPLVDETVEVGVSCKEANEHAALQEEEILFGEDRRKEIDLPLLPDEKDMSEIALYLEKLTPVYCHLVDGKFNNYDLKLERIVKDSSSSRTFKGLYRKQAVEVTFCHRDVAVNDTERFLNLGSPLTSKILAFLSGDIMCFIYAYMKYGSLEMLMAENRKRECVSLPHVECLLFSLLKGVNYLADNGIIHANICPQTVLISDNGHPLISNFSWSFVCDHGIATPAVKTAPERFNVAYAAPERLFPIGSLTPAADIFSVGCVIYAVVAGRPPFQGHTDEETIANILDRSVLPASGTQLFGYELTEVVNSCLSKGVKDRMSRGTLVRKFFLNGYQSSYLGRQEPSALLPMLQKLYGQAEDV